MAVPQIIITKTGKLSCQYFDGIPDGNGGPSGNEIVPAGTVTWACTPSNALTITSTGKETADAVGAVVAKGIVVTATEPVSGFVGRLVLDTVPLEQSIKSARINLS